MLSALLSRAYTVIRQKEPFTIYAFFLYLPIVILLKWQMHMQIAAIYFASGAVLGIYILSLSESLLSQSRSPFRSVFFCLVLLVVTLFVVTSSGSQFSSGLVLGMYLDLILLQRYSFVTHGTVHSWFEQVNAKVDAVLEKRLYWSFIGAFVIATLLYLRA